MHLLIFGFSPEKHENTLKVSNKILTETMSLRKKEQSYRSIPFMLSLVFIKVKRISKAIIKRYADIGSPWRAPFFN